MLTEILNKDAVQGIRLKGARNKKKKKNTQSRTDRKSIGKRERPLYTEYTGCFIQGLGNVWREVCAENDEKENSWLLLWRTLSPHPKVIRMQF